MFGHYRHALNVPMCLFVCVNESMLMSGLLLSSLLGELFVAVVRHPSLALQTRPSLAVSSSPQRPDGCEAAGWRECNELSFV